MNVNWQQVGKIYTTCKDTNYGYKRLNIRSTFSKLFFFIFVQSLAWLQTLKNTFVYKSTYFLKVFAVTQHFSYSFLFIYLFIYLGFYVAFNTSYSFKHNCFVYTKN